MFCQWSSVSTISRTTLWQRYDKERLSTHCRKASCAKLNTLLATFRQFGLKDTPFWCRTGCLCLFRQFPPWWTLALWLYKLISLSSLENIFFHKSSCAFGLLFLRSNRVQVKRQVIFRKQSSFRRKSILHDRLALIALSTLRKAEKSSQAQARWLNKRENKTF